MKKIEPPSTPEDVKPEHEKFIWCEILKRDIKMYPQQMWVFKPFSDIQHAKMLDEWVSKNGILKMHFNGISYSYSLTTFTGITVIMRDNKSEAFCRTSAVWKAKEASNEKS